MTHLSLVEGWLIIAVYAAGMIALTLFFSKRYKGTKKLFLVAGRKLNSWESGFSIAATWIWAPALFIASQKAYTQGIAGVFWFTVPNILCLIIFAWFAKRMRTLLPEGFTLSDFVRSRFSDRVHNLYSIELGGLAICSFAVQLLAGGAVLSALTGISFFMITLALSLTALVYSLYSGLKASVVTDYAQMIFIYVVSLILVPWAIVNGGGWGAVVKGLGGISGTYGSIFSGDGGNVFFSFGIIVTIGLIAGPFGDQSFWQRAFSTEKKSVGKAFMKGALFFGVVPIVMSLLGFLAAGNGLAIKDPQLTNMEAVLAYLPGWTIFPFTLMLLSGLVSTLDSNLSSLASMAGHDYVKRFLNPEADDDDQSLKYARIAMISLAVIGMVIANLPGMKILYLFLFYGTLRASTLLPTVITLLGKRLSERGVFWGISMAICIGLPVFAYGGFTKQLEWKLFGSIFTVLTPMIVSLLVTKMEGTVSDGAQRERA